MRTLVIGRVRPVRTFASMAAFALLATALVFLVPERHASGQTAAAQPDGLDHFMCYASSVDGSSTTKPFPKTPRAVHLRNQFSSFFAAVASLNQHCNPATKILPSGEEYPAQNPRAHLACWRVKPNEHDAPRQVLVRNQFGDARLEVRTLVELCLPSWKSDRSADDVPVDPAAPPGLDHFSCYATRYVRDTPKFGEIPRFVRVKDQFGEIKAKVRSPQRLCLPTEKRVRPDEEAVVTNPEAHLVCFSVAPEAPVALPRKVWDGNQFGVGQVEVKRTGRLCLPSFKTIAG